jgi:hypothetical protein
VNTDGFAKRDCCARSSDPALGNALGVGCINVNTDGVSTSAGVNGCRDTAQGFPKNNMGTTVQNSHNLAVSINGHSRDGTFSGNLE